MTEDEMKTSLYENEAEQTRGRIASTVGDLQNRLSPRTMMHDAVGSLRDRGAGLYDSASRLVREHPVAVSIMGLSLGLLLINRDRISGGDSYSYDEDYDGGYDAAADMDAEPGTLRRGWDRMRESASNAGERVSESAAAARDYTAETWHSTRERAADYASRMRLQASESLDENPLVGALIGLAAGAVLGALLPRSRRENELLGEASDRVADAARSAARAARDAGRRQLDEMGVNADAAKAKLDDLTDQAKEVARTATKAATNEIKSRTDTSASNI